MFVKLLRLPNGVKLRVGFFFFFCMQLLASAVCVKRRCFRLTAFMR